METDGGEKSLCRLVGLGNFLSGMETGNGDKNMSERKTLETSLVEWKQRFSRRCFVQRLPPWKLP